MHAHLLVLSLLLTACDADPGKSPLTDDTGSPGDTEDSHSDSPTDTGAGDTAAGDTGAGDTGGSQGSAPIDVPESEGCENLNPIACAFPWPTDRYLEPDDDTPTGYRLAYTSEFLPDAMDTDSFDFAPFQRLDGMPTAPQIMTLFQRPADVSDVASWQDIQRSLDEDSPTVILDLETGERVAHWAELDARAVSEDQTILYLRPASALQEDRTYAVALRNLTDADGLPLEETEYFLALRDALPTTSEELEARRASYEDMFVALEAAGVVRRELQQAWWFHTASGDSIRGDMMHIRQDALSRLGDQGIACVVEDVEEDYGSDGLTWRRLRGTFTVPSYVDSPTPPAKFVRGDDDLPEFVEYVEVDWTMIIPWSLAEAEDGPVAGPLVTFGHGLMGRAESYLGWSDLRGMAYDNQMVMMGTDWAGMCEDDITTLAMALYNPSNFVYISERLQQGMVNQMALTRTFAGVCSDLEEFYQDGVNLVDSSRLHFVGASQGGILGGTLMTLTPDIQRGILLVNGAVFPIMVERSVDFEPFYPYIEAAFPERLQQAQLLPFVAHLWDHAEPTGYLPHISEGLDGVGPRQVLSIAARNDAEVPNVATDMAMRMVGVPVLTGSAREPWGFEVVDSPWEGSAYITVDMGDPDVPDGNLPPETNGGGHYNVCLSDTALQMMKTFLDDGVTTVPCDGTCDPD